MFGLTRRPRPEALAAERLLESARLAARSPALYGEGRVPDTIDGRFESMVLHVALLVDRLRQGGAESQATGQALFDALFRDLDAAIRELGAGDVSVGKKVRRMGEAFYGRLKAYRAALDDAGQEELEAALSRNLFASSPASPAFLAAAAAYVRSAADALRAQPVEELAGGATPRWPALPG